MKLPHFKSSWFPAIPASLCSLLLLSSHYQTSQGAVWLGLNPDMSDGSNWSTGEIPGDSEILEFNGSGTHFDLTYPSTFQGAGAGVGTITLRSQQAEDVTINTASGNQILRLAGNAGITMEAGAGALTIGNVNQGTTVINLGGTNGTANFINNSSSLATFGAHSMLNRGGSSSAQSLVFGGSGNWELLGTVNTSLDHQFTKTGVGKLLVSKYLGHQKILLEQGESTFQNGFQAKELLRVGGSGLNAKATVTGGAVTVGSGNVSHAMYVGHRTTTSPQGATVGELDLSSATQVEISVHTLEIGKHESLSGTTGNVSGKLILSASGSNLIQANTVLQGHISGGSTTTVRGDLVLGLQNTFLVNDWYIGSNKGIASTTMVAGGVLEIGALSQDRLANLHIGANLSSGTGTKPIESVMDLSLGSFIGTLGQLNVGVFGNAGSGGGKGSLIFNTGAGELNVNEINLAQTGGTDVAQTTGSLRMKGGILNVLQGVTDGGGLSSFHVDAGTVTVGAGFSVDSFTAGYAANLSVQTGAIRVGNGAAADLFSVGWRSTDPSINSNHVLDFSANEAVTIDVNRLDLSYVRTLTSGSPRTDTTLKLSQYGRNEVTAKTVWLSHVTEGSTGRTSSQLVLGVDNHFAVDDFYVGSWKGIGQVYFAEGSGELSLVGATRAASNVYVGYNHSPGTSTVPEESHLNLAGGTFNATLGDLVVGWYGNTTPTGSNNGGGRGKVTFQQGTLTVDHILLASTVVPKVEDYTKTQGTFIMHGGDLKVNRVSRGKGVAEFQFHGGVLKVGQFGDATNKLNLLNTGSGTLDHGVHSQIGTTLIHGNYQQGHQATVRFDLSLTQGSDLMQVNGDIFLDGSLLLNSLTGGTLLVDHFTLIENLGTSGIAGQFIGLGEGAMVTLDFGTVAGLYQLSYEGGASGRDVVLTQVPEPTRWILGVAGIAGLALRRRR